MEDATGGYYALASGAAVLGAGGLPVLRPQLADAQGSDWTLASQTVRSASRRYVSSGVTW